MFIYLYCLGELSRLGTNRLAFYSGLVIGLLTFGPQLRFFWTIFGPVAFSMWTILSLWIGFFLLLVRLCRIRFGSVWTAALIPFIWTGLEYFRSELNYLRFSWLNVGYAFSDSLGSLPMRQLLEFMALASC